MRTNFLRLSLVSVVMAILILGGFHSPNSSQAAQSTMGALNTDPCPAQGAAAVAAVSKATAVASMSATVSNQNLPPGAQVVYQRTISSVMLQSEFDLVHIIFDLPAGGATPIHTHPGPVSNIVLEGNLTRCENGTEQSFGPGEGWSDQFSEVHQALNKTSANARFAAAFLVPKGAKLTTAIQPSASSAATVTATGNATGSNQNVPAGLKTVYQATITGVTLQGEFDVVHIIFDLPVGGATIVHTHPGPVSNIVLIGELTLSEKGTTQTLKPGESWNDIPGEVHQVLNKGTASVRFSSVFLVPKGAKLTSPATMPAPASK